ncbi:hypothetical protein COU75_01195 [Candidatus Peregrinibacteria bacterium CG10_big_fil_rev_8_21_14_0_10_42_8]|nr:MAG: hypothetical protein COU75_01195 [Candidatus Peregrinibacteria bacterium CG10_big_fil_rev_8_21_14_0_10_42_8]
MKKNLGIIIGFIILLVAGFYAFNAYIYNEKQGDGTTVSAYRGTLTGKKVCLTYTDTSEPQPTGCELGIQTDAGEYYALNFVLLSQTPDPELVTGDRFSASGLITPIEMLSTDQWRKYGIEGIFSVTDSIEKL